MLVAGVGCWLLGAGCWVLGWIRRQVFVPGAGVDGRFGTTVKDLGD